MDIVPEIQNRYSCRSYRPAAVDEQVLNRIMEAARLAPSARNFQEWRFVVVDDPDLRAKLVPACNNQEFVGQAPVIIAGCGVNNDNIMRCGQHSTPIDVAIAMEHIALQATREGLATCWIGSFFEDQVKKLLGIPDDVRVIELMTLGQPADQVRSHNRVDQSKIVCFNRWSL